MKKRRFLDVVLAAVLVMSVCTLPASATGTNGNIQEVVQFTEQQLLAIAPTKELYGFSSDTNFNSLYLASEIPSFEVVNGSLETTDIKIFPIVNGSGAIVAFSTVTWIDDVITGSVTTQLVDKLSETGSNENRDFSFIYDVDTAYIATAEEITPLSTFDSSLGYGREELNVAATDTSALQASLATFSNDILIPLDIESTNINSRASSAALLYVEKLSQLDSNGNNLSICWACTSASIGNYLTSKYFSGVGFANATYGTNTAVSMYNSILKLNSLYGLSYSTYNGAAQLNTVYNHLSSGYPLFGSFDVPGSSIKHFVVICGINLSTDTFTVMDPEYTSSYTQGSCSTGKLVYTSLYSAKVLTNDGYGYNN